MASIKEIKENDVDNKRLRSIDERIECPEDKPSPQVKLVPLTVGLCLAVFLLSVDRTIVAVAAPYLSNEFNSFADIGWYGSAYLITLCCVQPVFGKVYTNFNTKWTYVASFTIFEIGSLTCALAPSSAALIIGRVVAGAGAGGVLSGSYVIVAQTVPMRIRPAYTAAVATMFSLGAILAPLLGAAFTQHATWRWCFYINLPIGCPVLIGIAAFFHPPDHAGSSRASQSLRQKLHVLDIIGMMLFSGCTIMLLMGFQCAADYQTWSSSLVAGVLSGAVALGLAFATWQLKNGDKSLIPPRIIKQRTVLASTIANVAMYAALVTYIYFLVIYFQAIKGRSVIASAVDLLPLIGCSSVLSIVTGILVTKTLYFTPPAIIGTALALIGSGLLTMLTPTTTTASLAGYEVLVGIGMGLALQTGFFGVQAVLPATDIPVGTSLMTLAQSLGGALGVSIANAVLLCTLQSWGPKLAQAGIDIDTVIQAGATGFRKSMSEDDIDVLLVLYNHALNRVFVMACIFSAIAWFATCFMEFTKTVETPKETSQEDSVAGQEEIDAAP